LAAKTEESCRDRMIKYAPKLLKELADEISLRGVARLIGKSPTYLSQVMNKQISVSPDTFVLLVELKVRTSN
jgi:hypothetical protein